MRVAEEHETVSLELGSLAARKQARAAPRPSLIIPVPHASFVWRGREAFVTEYLEHPARETLEP